MTLPDDFRIEPPQLRIPIYLIIDDGSPLYLNDLITFDKEPPPDLVEYRLAENQYRGKTKYEASKLFIENFVKIIDKNGLKGKLSILPYVSDIGMIDNIPECQEKPLIENFIQVIRKDIMPKFDITPEVITHNQVYDIENDKFFEEKEWHWCDKQSTETLERYISYALKVLKNAGFIPTGVTSPCDFAVRVEDKYVTAIRNSIKKVCGDSFSWYFLHSAKDGYPQIMHFNRLKKEAVVSIVYIISDIGLRKRYGDDINSLSAHGKMQFFELIPSACKPLLQLFTN